MKIEYEATFPNIDKNELRLKLKRAGAKLLRPEFLQKRSVFDLPAGVADKHSWLRVRDEGSRITLSLKRVSGEKISDQKEICFQVDDFAEAEEFLKMLGCRYKAFQESKRELWSLAGVEITIDEWPFLEPFLEIEGVDETAVREVAEKLSLDYSQAKFCAVDRLYIDKYQCSDDFINHQLDRLIFEGENPFL